MHVPHSNELFACAILKLPIFFNSLMIKNKLRYCLRNSREQMRVCQRSETPPSPSYPLFLTLSLSLAQRLSLYFKISEDFKTLVEYADGSGCSPVVGWANVTFSGDKRISLYICCVGDIESLSSFLSHDSHFYTFFRKMLRKTYKDENRSRRIYISRRPPVFNSRFSLYVNKIQKRWNTKLFFNLIFV